MTCSTEPQSVPSGFSPVDEHTPKDRLIDVFAPGVYGLPFMVTHCQWHPDAGYCVDELRSPTHWRERYVAQPHPPTASVEAVVLKDIRARIEELRPYQHSPTFIEHFASGLLKTIDDALTAQHPALQGGGGLTTTVMVCRLERLRHTLGNRLFADDYGDWRADAFLLEVIQALAWDELTVKGWNVRGFPS